LKPIPFDAPITNSNVIAFDNHLVNPYIQNFNLELQRQLANNLTLELRYIGTKGTKLFPATGFSLNINPANAIENGILEAFKVTQAGGDAALFNQMLNGITLTGVGTVNGTSLTGSAALQQFSGTRTFLANGDPSGLANYLARTAPAGGKVGDYVRRNGFPENFILTNPQVGTNQALLWTNAANSTYQSFNVAITKRLSHGFTNQSTYSWSKTLGTSIINPRQRSNKTLLAIHRTHDFRSNGTYELPFGPNRLLLTNAPAWLTRVVERWQLGAAFNVNTGAPLSLTTGINNPYGLAQNFPNLAAPLTKSLGKVQKTGLAPGVVTYFEGLGQAPDPIRSTLTTAQTLNAASTNFAITDSSGKIILQNPTTGNVGNLGDNYLEGPGSISLDANLLKTVRIGESKEFVIRLDAINVLNHPNWGNPTTSINSTSFGRIALPTTGNRQFVFNARVNF
jgi:hypothetical protein